MIVNFMVRNVGFEQKGYEVLAPALVVRLAVVDDILGEISKCGGYVNLGLKDGEREGRDRREPPENEHGDKSRAFAAQAIKSPRKTEDLSGIRSVTDRIEVVTKSDAADGVQRSAGSIVKDVDLDGRLA